MQNIYITEWFKVPYAATVASSRSRERWDAAKEQEEHSGRPPGEPGTQFCNRALSPKQN